jgi:hypothetical protein
VQAYIAELSILCIHDVLHEETLRVHNAEVITTSVRLDAAHRRRTSRDEGNRQVLFMTMSYPFEVRRVDSGSISKDLKIEDHDSVLWGQAASKCRAISFL